MKQYLISASNLAKFLGFGYSVKDKKVYLKEGLPCKGMNGVDAYMHYLNTRPIPIITNKEARDCKRLENDDIDLYETKFNATVTDRNEKLYLRKIDLNTEHEYYLYGSVDGLLKDSIFEMKRCTSRAKDTNHPWNKIQLECLMFLTGLEKAILCKQDKSLQVDPNPTIHNYDHDAKYWNFLLMKFKGQLIKFDYEKPEKVFRLKDEIPKHLLRRFEVMKL